MSFRGNHQNNRNRNYGGNMAGGGGANRMNNISPWSTTNTGNFGGHGGNMRQGGGSGPVMNVQALNLANNLLNNLFRNQNPPSLLDLPRGGGGGGGGSGNSMGNRNQRGGPMMNRGGGYTLNNRGRGQGGYSNRSGLNNKQSTGGGIRKQNAFDRAKKVLNKNNTTRNKTEADTTGREMDDDKEESIYANVPNDMFYCHLCKKHMWDAVSFENHIKGRTHLTIRESIEESYRLKANMIRQEAKIAEQLKSIELDRLKRRGKGNQRASEYCTMCDLNFLGHISMHRKSDGHLQLKKFLHPKCSVCTEEFATRIDYDSHLLSADHLIKAAEKNTKVGEAKQNTLLVHSTDDELKDVRQPARPRKKLTKPLKKEGEEGDTETAGDGVDSKQDAEEAAAEDGAAKEAGGDESKEQDDLNETQEESDVAVPADPEDCILDFAEGDEIPVEVENRLPVYNWQRPVGSTFIHKLECFECSLCSKFLDSDTTVEIHSRTATHHRNFLKFINEKANDAKIAVKRAAAALEHSERKRRRVEELGAAKNGETEEKDAEQPAADDKSGDFYDPAEATGDDADVEMSETAGGETGEAGDNEVDAEYVDEDQQDEPQTDTTVVEKKDVLPVPIIKTEVKPVAAVVQTTPVKPLVTSTTDGNVAAANTTTPVAAAAVTTEATPEGAAKTTAAPVQSPQVEQSPVIRKNTAIRGGNANRAKGTPRGRGRGRYNRY